jgi:hypothetical protein
MKRFIEGAERAQSTLFPEYLENWVDENNPVRVIDVFVDALDLAGWDLTGGARGDRAAVVSSISVAEAVHLRISQPGAIQPAAGTRSWATTSS